MTNQDLLLMFKKLILLVLPFFVLSVHHTYAQRIMGAVIAGVNATQVDGDEVFGYHKFGLNAGAAAIIPFNNKWSVSIENIYSQKGAHQRSVYLDSLDGSYDLKLNYLDVPVLVQFTDKDIVTFGAGMSWGRLVGIAEQRNGYDLNETTLESGIYRSSDLNLLIDVKFRLIDRLRFNVRYAYSVRPIATREIIDSKTGKPNIRDQYNGMFTFRLYYVFNERLSRESRSQTPQIR
ncbi:MAG: PorT family protein [Lentimicrobiaceae bacterium]|nr:PorT family protein [Lentimicrobiaceae bacterium]MCB9023528.1 PorT family protein [Lentimicrobiaceae bacterium]MCO5266599.1 PorT family protein [Lentimicrobium sp.]